MEHSALTDRTVILSLHLKIKENQERTGRKIVKARYQHICCEIVSCMYDREALSSTVGLSEQDQYNDNSS